MNDKNLITYVTALADPRGGGFGRATAPPLSGLIKNMQTKHEHETPYTHRESLNYL